MDFVVKEKFLEKLAKNPIEYLNIGGCILENRKCFEIISKMPNLKYLSLASVNVSFQEIA